MNRSEGDNLSRCMDLTVDHIVALLRRAATELPADVLRALTTALKAEPPGIGQDVLAEILENARLAAQLQVPMCQDTGVPFFFVRTGPGSDGGEVEQVIRRGVERATAEVPLRPNVVDAEGATRQGNLGTDLPIIHWDLAGERDTLEVRVLLKGAGSENIGRLYSLPDAHLDAGRNLGGIAKCVLDAALAAQGRGCPPYLVYAAVGALRHQVTLATKRLMLRSIEAANPDASLAAFETAMLDKLNSLGVGPAGLGGRCFALAVRLDWQDRHPACFWVDVSFNCWAARRASLRIQRGAVEWGV